MHSPPLKRLDQSRSPPSLAPSRLAAVFACCRPSDDLRDSEEFYSFGDRSKLPIDEAHTQGTSAGPALSDSDARPQLRPTSSYSVDLGLHIEKIRHRFRWTHGATSHRSRGCDHAEPDVGSAPSCVVITGEDSQGSPSLPVTASGNDAPKRPNLRRRSGSSSALQAREGSLEDAAPAKPPMAPQCAPPQRANLTQSHKSSVAPHVGEGASSISDDGQSRKPNEGSLSSTGASTVEMVIPSTGLSAPPAASSLSKESSSPMAERHAGSTTLQSPLPLSDAVDIGWHDNNSEHTDPPPSPGAAGDQGGGSRFASRDSDGFAGESTQAQRDLAAIKVLTDEIAVYYREEQLFRAWASADLGLKLASRYSERVKAEWRGNREAAESLAAEFLGFHKKLMRSDVYQNVTAKVDLLLLAITTFDLEDRFDITAISREGNSYQVNQRLSRTTSWASVGGESGRCNGSPSFTYSAEKSAFPIVGNTTLGFVATTATPTGERINAAVPNTPASNGARAGSILNARRRLSRKGQSSDGALGAAGGQPKRRFFKRKVTPAGSAKKVTSAWTEETKGGLRLLHKINHSDGTIGINMKAKLRIPLFKVLAILNEVDYYDKWVPYCKACKNIGQLSRASMVLQQLCDYPWPIKQKENMSYCFGVDALDEFGCIMIHSCSPPDGATTFMGCRIPPPQKNIPRIPSSKFLFILFPENDGVDTILECHASIDPGITALRSVVLPLIRMITVRSVRGFFYKIGQLASSFKSSGYEEKIQENREIYDWIQRRIQEGVASDKFPKRTSSVASLVFDDIKEPIK